jgi:flagellar motor switch protein FliM
MLHLQLGVRGVMAEFPLSVRELLELRPGDVVGLPGSTGTPAIVELEGIPRFTAAVGTVRRRKALQIVSILPRGEASHGRDGS